uniref:Uncharacterized protein n=2 Tax=Cacopsylla melanoneura TaxID=428564 RepID=A0A8D8ZRX3_9HEMI
MIKSLHGGRTIWALIGTRAMTSSQRKISFVGRSRCVREWSTWLVGRLCMETWPPGISCWLKRRLSRSVISVWPRTCTRTRTTKRRAMNRCLSNGWLLNLSVIESSLLSLMSGRLVLHYGRCSHSLGHLIQVLKVYKTFTPNWQEVIVWRSQTILLMTSIPLCWNVGMLNLFLDLTLLN